VFLGEGRNEHILRNKLVINCIICICVPPYKSTNTSEKKIQHKFPFILKLALTKILDNPFVMRKRNCLSIFELCCLLITFYASILSMSHDDQYYSCHCFVFWTLTVEKLSLLLCRGRNWSRLYLHKSSFQNSSSLILKYFAETLSISMFFWEMFWNVDA
jgi:hypothetical protein